MMIRFLPLLAGAAMLAGCLPTFETPATTNARIAPAVFERISSPFMHTWVEPSHPFTGASVIDIDGDGRMEVFVGGGRGQADMLLAFRDGVLVDIIEGRGISSSEPATYGSASSDLDRDGDVDLIVARDNGVTVYENTDTGFKSRPLDVTLQDGETVVVSVSVSDVDSDGDGDLYLSAFVTFSAFRSATFNDATHAKQNILLVNVGDLQFVDVTERAGVKGNQNTFHTTFADLDNDGDQDMILSQNTGQIEVFRRTGRAQFEPVTLNTGYGFWMGLAVADIDADGDQDFFASNIGTSIPDFLTDGDLREDQNQYTNWGLFRNDGGMVFADVAGEYNLLDYGFAWGAQFADLNLDGYEDLLVAQNYIKWPVHQFAPLNGKVLMRVPDAPEGPGFYYRDGLGLDNPYFGQSPLIVDLDGDGRADVMWLNMNGPATAFLNRTEANFLTVRLPDSPDMLGAHVTLRTRDGIQRRQVVASTGLMTDPTPDIHFGLGDVDAVDTIELLLSDGSRQVIDGPEINRAISFDLRN